MTGRGSQPDPVEIAILSGMLTGRVQGPLHLANAIGLGRTRLQSFTACVDSLRARGLIQAPADTGAELWTVTPEGREYLAACHSRVIETMVGGIV